MQKLLIISGLQPLIYMYVNHGQLENIYSIHLLESMIINFGECIHF